MGIGNIQNPYQTDYTGLVDQQLGTAYLVVREMVKNLGLLNQVSHYMPQLVSIGDAIDDLLELEISLPILKAIYEKLEELLAIADDVVEVAKASEEIKIVANNIQSIIDIVENMDDVKNAAQLVVGLRENSGADQIGTSAGITVQDFLDMLSNNLDNLKAGDIEFRDDAVYPPNTVGNKLARLPSEVDAAGTASSLVNAHNSDPQAHPELSNFITQEANRAEVAADVAEQVSSMSTYLTKADADASLPQSEGTYIRVTNDPAQANNGYWVSDGSQWIWSGVQPIGKRDIKQLNQKIDTKLGFNVIQNDDVLFGITDKEGFGTDVLIRRSDGQFEEFVIDRLAPRIAERLNPQDLGKVIPYPQVAGSNHPVLGSDFYMRGGELLPVLTDMTQMAGWGSSSMFRSNAAFLALAQSIGASYYNGGVSGHRTEQIAARLGSIPALCTFPENTIPSSTDEISIVVPGINWHAGQDYLGTVNGIHGRLRYSGGPKFSRSDAGEPVHVEPGTPFLPDAGAQNRASVTFLWMGRNDLSAIDDRPETCIKNTDKSFDWLAPLIKRVLVLGHFKGNLTPDSYVWDRIDRVNAAHRDRYGRLFVDVNAYLISPQVWIDMDLTPTQQDLDQQAVGTTPASLLADGLHLTNAAYQAVVTYCVRARMVELGWI